MNERPIPSSGYKTQSLDTDRRTEELQFALWARLAPHERLALLASTCEAMWNLKMRALAEEHPGASREELERIEAEQRLGKDLAERAFQRARELGLRS